jgi:hypothetical protein
VFGFHDADSPFAGSWFLGEIITLIMDYGGREFKSRFRPSGERPCTELSESLFEKSLFCPISASGENFNPRNTTCIPPVKIFLPSLNSNKIWTFQTGSEKNGFWLLSGRDEEN